MPVEVHRAHRNRELDDREVEGSENEAGGGHHRGYVGGH